MSTYIHYGHNGNKTYDPEKFREIKNQEFIKPVGGLWASAVDATYGWKDWCEDQSYSECDPGNAFTFKLASWARVLVIDSTEVLKTLPKADPPFRSSNVFLDFEKIKESYDAIELLISKDQRLYYKLYGWDCDCILVLNKDAIKEVTPCG